MTTTFLKILPEQIANLPAQAIKYLEDAIIRTPASTSRLDVTLDIAKKGFGNIYLIYVDEVLKGASYILVYDTKIGKIVAPVLLAGDDMELWNEEFHNFMYEFGGLLGAKKARWIGRKGWKKAYPKSKVIGYVYEHDYEPYGGSI